MMYELEYFVYHLRAFGVSSNTPIMEAPPTTTPATTASKQDQPTKYAVHSTTKGRQQALVDKTNIEVKGKAVGIDKNVKEDDQDVKTTLKLYKQTTIVPH